MTVFSRMEGVVSRAAVVAAFSVVLVGAGGCASTQGYLLDRGRDAADIFTLAAETGIGAKFRAGPIAVGCMSGDGTIGLRGGRFVAEERGYQMLGVFPPISEGADDITVLGFYNLESLHSDSLKPRHKTFHGGDDAGLGMWLQQYDSGGDNPAYYTQVELTAGVGILFKIGLNPGELLDFVLGWTTLDIFHDDIGLGRKEK